MGLLPALITKTLRENSRLLRQTRLIGHCKLNEVRKDGWTKLIRCLWLDQLLFYYMKEGHRSYGRNSFTVAKRKPEKFLFATTKVASITALIFFHTILHPEVLIYDFHIFLTSSSSFYRFITKVFNDLLPAGLLVQLVERCPGIAEVKGSNPVQARKMFFHALFSKLQKLLL